jgi:hypothetical protein
MLDKIKLLTDKTQCGLSESDAWLRSQEDELVARFSAYSITPQVEQVPIESKPAANRIVYASAAAHSFIVSPYNTNGHPSAPSKNNEATWYVSFTVSKLFHHRSTTKSTNL